MIFPRSSGGFVFDSESQVGIFQKSRVKRVHKNRLSRMRCFFKTMASVENMGQGRKVHITSTRPEKTGREK